MPKPISFKNNDLAINSYWILSPQKMLKKIFSSKTLYRIELQLFSYYFYRLLFGKLGLPPLSLQQFFKITYQERQRDLAR